MVMLSIDAATGQRDHEPDIWVTSPAAGIWHMEIDLGRGYLPRTGSEQQAWLKLSQSTLAEGWDNPQDAQYDALQPG